MSRPESDDRASETWERRAREVLLESARIKHQLAETLAPEIARAAAMIVKSLRSGGTVVLFGNGGSAADAQHIAGELVGRFLLERSALAAIALTTDTSVLTSIANDYDYDEIFARQVEALVKPGDVAIAISTSGNARNVLRGVEAARAAGARVLGLTGETGGALAAHCDLCLKVPSKVTARIQEAHITIGHIICELVEDALAGQQAGSVT